MLQGHQSTNLAQTSQKISGMAAKNEYAIPQWKYDEVP
jgi:hypothetical protein